MPPPPGPLPEASGSRSVTNPEPGQESGLPPVATGGMRGVGYAALILAAGLSTRMRDNKVLLPWRDGRPIVAHVADLYASAGIDSIIVVTGRDASEVRAAVADLDVRCVHNPDYASGEMLSSVKVGLGALPEGLALRRHKPVAAAFIQPADMPCVPQSLIGALAAAHEPGWNLAPRCLGRRGHPVLLDRSYWRAMLELPADAKPRAVLRGSRLRLLDVEDAGVLLDLDTRAAYERALALFGCSNLSTT